MSPVYEWIGNIAAVLTTASFLPQVYKTWQTKSVESLSLPMLTLFFIGIWLWLIYGFALESFPIIASNIITIISGGLLIYFKLKYK